MSLAFRGCLLIPFYVFKLPIILVSLLGEYFFLLAAITLDYFGQEELAGEASEVSQAFWWMR